MKEKELIQKLFDIAEDRGLTMAEIADRMQYSQNQCYGVKSERYPPTDDFIQTMAEMLNLIITKEYRINENTD